MSDVQPTGTRGDAPQDQPVADPPEPVAPTETPLAAGDETSVIAGRSFGRQTWDRLRRHKLAMFAVGMMTLLVGAFVFGPMVISQNAFAQDFTVINQAPSAAHPMGTDNLGRDLMARIFIGGRYSMRIAILVALLSTAIGTVIGAFSGYFGGLIDTMLDQITNLFLIVPYFVVLLVLTIRFGVSPNAVAILISLLVWPQIARVVRGLFLQFKQQEFVLAARAAGARAPRIMFRHILPNTFGPIVVNATLLIGTAIILESTLSFLGILPLGSPTLGNLINESKGSIDSRPWAVLFPAAFIVSITLSVNFLGDGLRDALDPTSRKG
jgi:peptide/nickel transport system permease protein